jgi:hypothetical protein
MPLFRGLIDYVKAILLLKTLSLFSGNQSIKLIKPYRDNAIDVTDEIEAKLVI